MAFLMPAQQASEAPTWKPECMNSGGRIPRAQEKLFLIPLYARVLFDFMEVELNLEKIIAPTRESQARDAAYDEYAAIKAKVEKLQKQLQASG